MKPDSRPDHDPVMTPESAVWLLYAGLLQGIRWRRHLVASSPRTRAAAMPRPLRGPAPR